MENFDFDKKDIFSLEVDDQAKSTFMEMARWTKFLAIMGFVFLGLMIGVGVVLAIAVQNLPMENNPFAAIGGTSLFVIYVVMAGISFYPVYALLKYSVNIKTALVTNSKDSFNVAIMYLKNMFKYSGILTIIMLCIYGIMLVFGILGGYLATR